MQSTTEYWTCFFKFGIDFLNLCLNLIFSQFRLLSINMFLKRFKTNLYKGACFFHLRKSKPYNFILTMWSFKDRNPHKNLAALKELEENDLWEFCDENFPLEHVGSLNIENLIMYCFWHKSAFNFKNPKKQNFEEVVLFYLKVNLQPEMTEFDK